MLNADAKSSRMRTEKVDYNKVEIIGNLDQNSFRGGMDESPTRIDFRQRRREEFKTIQTDVFQEFYSKRQETK